MPLLIHAVPLHRTWLGVYYWKTPRPEDLPEELQYLPYSETQDRFLQLNGIARTTYPGYWPNVVISVFLAAVLAASVMGITQTGTNFAIIGQGGCFLLPITMVIWTKVRKESKERACKKFKQQSQKLLRIWSAQDTESHAMQWKLRHRSKSRARPWTGDGERSDEMRQHRDALYHEEGEQDEVTRRDSQQEQYTEATTLTTTRLATQAEATYMDGRQPGNITVSNEYAHEMQTRSAIETFRESSQTNPSGGLTTIAMAPSPIVSTYGALRIPLSLRRMSTLETVTSNQAVETTTRILRATTITVAEPTTTISATLSNLTSSSTTEPKSCFWWTLQKLLRSCYCCAYIFRERRVWLIEISLRECQLDEYVLTVPSPVYCGYRLPAYDDVFSPSNGSTSARSSRLAVNRYLGSPPVYENESDDVDDDVDEDV